MIYCLVQMNISNPDALGKYREKAAEALAKHGGAVAGAVPKPERLEGSLAVPDMAGVLSFPDREAAMAWFNDPELAELHDLRRSTGESTLLLIA